MHDSNNKSDQTENDYQFADELQTNYNYPLLLVSIEKADYGQFDKLFAEMGLGTKKGKKSA